MARILVSGGAGFIGGAMAEALAKDPENEVLVFDNLLTGALCKLPRSENKNVHFIQGDVNHFEDIAKVFQAWDFEYVFHYAALVGVLRTLQSPIKVLEDIDGIRNILELSKIGNVKRVFYSSSSEVYGEPFEIPQNEQTTPLNSRLPYAIVKNVGEAYLRSFHQEHDLNYTIFRFFNTYGPKQSDDFVMTKFIKAALRGEDITIYGDGAQTRTFCHIKDNVAACKRIFEENLHLNDTVNIGSDKEIPIIDLAKKILEISQGSGKIVHLPALSEGDMTRRCPDNSKMKNILQRELISLEDGIKELCEYLKEEEEHVRN
ncbi:MAG: NAD-dependent epimerase/dehydratase family protein [Bacteroidetes bacterium]|jgi:UDP-glucose 4-epimerase|nr:NAD-dependent epimerase/dehydratase family protein [Bacteroidota bacterium]